MAVSISPNSIRYPRLLICEVVCAQVVKHAVAISVGQITSPINPLFNTVGIVLVTKASSVFSQSSQYSGLKPTPLM